MILLLLKNSLMSKDYYKLWIHIMKLSINNDYFIFKNKSKIKFINNTLFYYFIIFKLIYSNV